MRSIEVDNNESSCANSGNDEEYNNPNNNCITNASHTMNNKNSFEAVVGGGANSLDAYCTLRSKRRKNDNQNVKFSSLRQKNRKVSQHDQQPEIPYKHLVEEQDYVQNVCSSMEHIASEGGAIKSHTLADDLINLNDTLNGDETKLVDQMTKDIKCKENVKSRKPKSLSNTLGKCFRHDQCQGDSLDTGQSQQQQSSLNEFNRFSSYCTLRPDQKRKYLLKTISLLRNSTNVSDEANKALMALHQLKVFESMTSSDKSACTDETLILSNDPEQVEDCLLELDKYLEEIERNYCVCSETSPSSTTATLGKRSNKEKENNHNLMHEIITANDVAAGSSSASGSNDGGTTLRVHQSTTTMKKDEEAKLHESNEKFIDFLNKIIDGKSEKTNTISRGHPHRNTISQVASSSSTCGVSSNLNTEVTTLPRSQRKGELISLIFVFRIV